ncbi:TPA: DNA-protecting protein DprA [Patescibacteria group bacterium]|uniref:Protecting protein DprA protein n=1 Tax=candidate division Kazan bacterium GW2011_GWB1_45_10 TaxID=1620411 RepID=A0A0G1N0T1_UNCK3|nr:MAG: protecting protein DprA protein [candidate division Kazan bacterium GW2011_GWB1_45_10]HAR54821.1 DNA-protecting protein DprA [Patescibacteria group bacterium]HCR42126.1 DNA-protecting protein DprA [Patescibacteria group bacterium]
MSNQIQQIDFAHPDYPSALKEIADPPPQLFVRGDLAVFKRLAVAIVGSRKPSEYGMRTANFLSSQLSQQLTIISGLAYGIDTIALTEAAKSPHGAIAVIGSGLDRDSFYPSSNWQLAEQIITAGGAVVSEYPEGTPPLKHHFPARNRIIAGLSAGVLVVEAGAKSGALITADLALDYNREVWAVAGNIFIPQATGSNQLLKDGAKFITGAEDILTDLNLVPIGAQVKMPLDLTEPERLIINILKSSPSALSVNEMIGQTQLDTAEISSTLTLMEIKGLVKSATPGKFSC